MKVPVFGTRLKDRTYVRRPSAYALLRNAAGQWAVVRTREGCFLPGGGMEPHETAEQTVEREAQEECGFVLKPGAVALQAIQFVYSNEEHQYFEKISEFVEAELIGTVAPSEKDHQTLWLNVDQAVDALSHESHRWAVSRASGRVS